jgi:serine/threonine protein kinase
MARMLRAAAASLASDPQSRERFHREAKTISQLDHPNICALYDVGERLHGPQHLTTVAHLFD